MKLRSTSGFSVVEVLVAVVVLGIGIMALASTSAIAARQLGQGRTMTIASQVATQRFDILRRAAAMRNASSQQCQNASFAAGTATHDTIQAGLKEAWTITGAGVGVPRTVTDTVTYRRNGGTSKLVLSTIIGCK